MSANNEIDYFRDLIFKGIAIGFLESVINLNFADMDMRINIASKLIPRI